MKVITKYITQWLKSVKIVTGNEWNCVNLRGEHVLFIKAVSSETFPQEMPLFPSTKQQQQL